MFESYINKNNANGDLARQFLDMLLNENINEATDLILENFKNGLTMQSIYKDIFQVCLYEIGRLWEINEISISREHYLTAAMQLVMSHLYTYIFKGYRNGKSIVSACIGNELHEIGIRMVADFFEIEGWETHYLGANVPNESIIQEIKDNEADILALSTTMECNIINVEKLIKQIREEEDLKHIKILVGGRPFILNNELWKSVGADGYAEDGETAIEKAKELIFNG